MAPRLGGRGRHTVVIEDLRVRNMTRSARGTVEEPGRHVRAKAGLNRVVLDTGWAVLRSMLKYKAGRTVAVNPATRAEPATPAAMSMPPPGVRRPSSTAWVGSITDEC